MSGNEISDSEVYDRMTKDTEESRGRVQYVNMPLGGDHPRGIRAGNSIDVKGHKDILIAESVVDAEYRKCCEVCAHLTLRGREVEFIMPAHGLPGSGKLRVRNRI